MRSSIEHKQRLKIFIDYLKRNEQYRNCWIWMAKHFDVMKDDLLLTLAKNPYKYDNDFLHWRICRNPFLDEIDDLCERYEKKSAGGANKLNLSEELDEIKYLFTKGPPHEQTIDFFVEVLKQNFCKRRDFYLKINLSHDYSLKEITAAVQNLIKEEVETNRYYHLLAYIKGNNRRKRNVGIDELQRYLLVYDTREIVVDGKKRKWRSVHEQIDPKETFTEEKRHNLLMYYKKAKLIIENSINCTDPRDFPLK